MDDEHGRMAVLEEAGINVLTCHWSAREMGERMSPGGKKGDAGASTPGTPVILFLTHENHVEIWSAGKLKRFFPGAVSHAATHILIGNSSGLPDSH
jgi:hypothetical protein